jgi:hypothetical protein
MKKCPNCLGMALYEDTLANCPICGEVLVDRSAILPGESGGASSPQPGSQGEHLLNMGRRISGDPVDNRESRLEGEGYIFERRVNGGVILRGAVAEIASMTRYQTRLQKMFNSLFRGEPYQFDYSSHLTRLRIEEHAFGRFPEQQRDVIYYGDIEGSCTYGDDVEITAIKKGDQLIAKRLYIHNTGHLVKPAAQIPAAFFRILFALIAILITYLVVSVVKFVSSVGISGLFNLLFASLLAIILPFLPLLIIIYFVWSWLRRFRIRRRW